MSEELVSVIVPVYNAEEYLDACINSVLGQTYQNFEILCINDGSTDSSLDILKKFSDPRIRIYSQPNQGVSVARNLGIDQAKGDYITFLDSDDVLDPIFLEMMLLAITKNKTLIAGCDYATFKTDFPVCAKKDAISIKCYQHPLFYYFFRLLPFHVMAGGNLCHKSFFKDLRFDTQISHGEDTLLFSQILMRSNAISFVSAPLYGYRQSENSLSRKPLESKVINDHILSFLKLSTLVQKENLNPFLRFLIYRKLMNRYFRRVCLKPYKLDKKNYVQIWDHSLSTTNELIAQKKFKVRYLEIRYLFLFWLWRKKYWKLLTLFL